jgi:hypothetical protein
MGNVGSIPGSYIFPAKYGPYYVKSFGAVLAVLSTACLLAFTLRFYLKYLNRKLDEELSNAPNATESSEAVNMRGFRYMY